MFLLKVFSFVSVICGNVLSEGTQEPIIGILSEEIHYLNDIFPENKYISFIANSYSEFVGIAGGRVVPIWIGQDKSYYETIVKYTNGLLFHGGFVDYKAKGGYGEAASLLFKLAKENNEKGIHYPILGICLGFQVLAFADHGDDVRIKCNMPNDAAPIELKPGYEKSRLYGDLTDKIKETLTQENSTYNYHHKCLTEKGMEKAGILKNWKILSTNKDRDGTEFISSMEHAKYPIFGLQFHPSKILYEFREDFRIPRSMNAIEAAQYFANTYIKEARKNSNKFPSKKAAQNASIYNYNIEYTAPLGSVYERVYAFTKKDFERIHLE